MFCPSGCFVPLDVLSQGRFVPKRLSQEIISQEFLSKCHLQGSEAVRQLRNYLGGGVAFIKRLRGSANHIFFTSTYMKI
jgi:hypothetical protein